MSVGYCIEYEGAEHYSFSSNRKNGLRRKICLAVVAIALAVSVIFPAAKEKLVSLLIPGNDAVTIQAVEELVTDLQSGDSTKDALTAFCRTVIENGQ